MDDRERVWLERALRGEAGAFGPLIDSYQSQVYNLCYRMLGSHGDAEDAAQETFVRAYTRLGTFQLDRKFSSWLLSIAAHYCIDRLRRRRLQIGSLDDDLRVESVRSPNPSPDEAVIRSETKDEIQAVVERLDPIYRAPLVLRYWHGMSYEEIADILGVSVPAVKTRLHRARLRLAGELRSARAGRLALALER